MKKEEEEGQAAQNTHDLEISSPGSIRIYDFADEDQVEICYRETTKLEAN